MARSGLNTLRNPLLYSRLKKQIEKQNPNFDLEHIDRELEYGEAVNELERKHGLHLTPTRQNQPMNEFRNFLHERGVEPPRLQNLIMARDTPATDDQLDNLAYVLSARSRHSWAVDRAKKSKKVTRDPFVWMNAPNRYDIQGIDTPGSSWPFY